MEGNGDTEGNDDTRGNDKLKGNNDTKRDNDTKGNNDAAWVMGMGVTAAVELFQGTSTTRRQKRIKAYSYSESIHRELLEFFKVETSHGRGCGPRSRCAK